MTTGPAGNCLLIGPRFFGYEADIAAALTAIGYSVDFVDERPSNSSIARALVRTSPRFMTSHVESYYKRLVARLPAKDYSNVIVLKGEVVPAWFLDELRMRSPAATFTFYTFDSINNSPNFLQLRDHFDKLYTFDPEDAKHYTELEYQPLFFTSHFYPGEAIPEYDLCFVGTLHSGRYHAVESLARHFGSVNTYYYCPARWWYIVGRCMTGEFRGIPQRKVGFSKLPREQVAERFRSARAVLDIQRTGQAGLTMRTFEVLASGAGLVTTNPHAQVIAEEAGGRVLVLDDFNSGTAADQVREFIDSLRETTVPDHFLERYSVISWARMLLSGQREAAEAGGEPA